jgi:type 1 glutamine amidotransferase
VFVSLVSNDIRVTWLAGGHPFDREALSEMIAETPGTVGRLVEWPEAGELFTHDGVDLLLRECDVLALYDLPGITFRKGDSPVFTEPGIEVIAAWQKIVEVGLPILGMHHAIASWPSWGFFAELLKGRFHYAPASLRGVEWPDSGWANPVEQIFTVVAPQHPVCAGLPASFPLTDETYLCPIFDGEITPLIVTDAPRDAEHHASAYATVRKADQGDWTHADMPNTVAWTHNVANSTVVYLQPGDGPGAFRNSVYRQLISNSIHWLASMNTSQPTTPPRSTTESR